MTAGNFWIVFQEIFPARQSQPVPQRTFYVWIVGEKKVSRCFPGQRAMHPGISPLHLYPPIVIWCIQTTGTYSMIWEVFCLFSNCTGCKASRFKVQNYDYYAQVLLMISSTACKCSVLLHFNVFWRGFRPHICLFCNAAELE